MPLFISNSRAYLAVFFSTVFVLLAVLFIASEILVRTRVVPNHNAYRHVALFLASPSASAAFGDSHVAYGITGIDGLVNLAFGGENFPAIHNKIRLYYSARAPERVIVQAGPHHFSRDFLAFRNEEAERFDSLRREKAWHGLYALHSLHRRELYGYWRTWLSGEGFVPRQSFENDGSQLNNGRYLEKVTDSSLRDSAIRRTLRILEPVKGFSRTVPADLHRDAVSFLRRRGGEVCLVSMPVIEPLRRTMAEMPSFVAARSFFRALAAENDARYVDLLDQRYPDHYFTDPHHLNAEGARAVSRDIWASCFPPSRNAAKPAPTGAAP